MNNRSKNFSKFCKFARFGNCANWPNNCKFVHPDCKFGAKCYAKNCQFQHPQKLQLVKRDVIEDEETEEYIAFLKLHLMSYKNHDYAIMLSNNKIVLEVQNESKSRIVNDSRGPYITVDVTHIGGSNYTRFIERDHKVVSEMTEMIDSDMQANLMMIRKYLIKDLADIVVAYSPIRKFNEEFRKMQYGNVVADSDEYDCS